MLVVEVKNFNHLEKPVYVLIGHRMLTHTHGIQLAYQFFFFVFAAHYLLQVLDEVAVEFSVINP